MIFLTDTKIQNKNSLTREFELHYGDEEVKNLADVRGWRENDPVNQIEEIVSKSSALPLVVMWQEVNAFAIAMILFKHIWV